LSSNWKELEQALKNIFNQYYLFPHGLGQAWPTRISDGVRKSSEFQVLQLFFAVQLFVQDYATGVQA